MPETNQETSIAFRPPSSALRASTIALLEDDTSLCRLITAALQNIAMKVITFHSIEAATAGLAAGEWDLLLCDRYLPDGDGTDLCFDIKSTPEFAGHYVIMLTADGSEQAKLHGFARGADDYITKPFSLPELVARVRAGLRIVDLQKALVESNQRLERLSNTDALTALPNRRAFEAEFMTSFEHARRYDRPLATLIVDIDHFKRINDVHGHLIGDRVLTEFGAMLAQNLRDSDVAARFGGEEFALVLPETHLLQACQVADKIRRVVAERTFAKGLSITTSIGVSSTPHTAFETPLEMLAAADRALYRAKNAGRNRVEMERRAHPQRESFPGTALAQHSM